MPVQGVRGYRPAVAQPAQLSRRRHRGIRGSPMPATAASCRARAASAGPVTSTCPGRRSPVATGPGTAREKTRKPDWRSGAVGCEAVPIRDRVGNNARASRSIRETFTLSGTRRFSAVQGGVARPSGLATRGGVVAPAVETGSPDRGRPAKGGATDRQSLPDAPAASSLRPERDPNTSGDPAMKPPALRRCAPPAAVTPGLTAAPAGALQAQETTVRMW